LATCIILSPARRARALAKRDALVADHMNLVPPIARGVAASLPPSFELDDLIATGNLALVKAAARYRPSAHGGAPFSAFARQIIRGAMLDSIRRSAYANATMQPLNQAAERAVEPVIETEIDDGRLRRRVKDAISWLSKRERAVLESYYSPDEPDLRAVGAIYELSRGRIKQIHRTAIEAIRRELSRLA
jgi:RNA polymerase sigma factor (sigma-70 family)